MKRLYEHKFVRHFLPSMILIIGGSFFVQEFTKLRYKYRKIDTCDFKNEVKSHSIDMKKPATIEEEYERIKSLDIDNWESVRIPRSWEQPNSTSN